MTFQKRLTDVQIKQLLVDHEDGWKVRELSVMYLISIRTVYRILAENEVRRVSDRRKKRIRPKPKVEKELKPCGTNAAYQRHRRNGEYPCTPCLEAHAENVAKAKEKKR